MSSTALPVNYERRKNSRRRNGNISHSFAYKLAGEGKIRLVELGGETLVDIAYSQPYFAVSMDERPDDAPVPSFGPRMRCSRGKVRRQWPIGLNGPRNYRAARSDDVLAHRPGYCLPDCQRCPADLIRRAPIHCGRPRARSLELLLP
jgi:hypothetical protein